MKLERNTNYWYLWHCFGSLFLALILSLFIDNIFICALDTLALGLIWEIWDGFKPNYIKGIFKPKWKQYLFYSDGFQYGDLIADSIGVVLFILVYLIVNI